jgi:hypothetical protein
MGAGLRRGNIDAADGPDPFPKTGLTKQYEPFIRKFVGRFCDEYPGAIYEHVLVDAVRISIGAETRFKPELGWDFSTFLRKHLLGLNRLYWNDRRQIKTPEQSDEKEADDPVGPLTYRGGNGTRITIDRRWHNGSGWQRVVLTRQLRSSDEREARAEVEQMSAAISKLLDDRPLTAIRASIAESLGEDVDVQFRKGRPPPNFHQWPSQVLLVSFDQVISRDEDEGKLSLADIIGGPDPRDIKNSDPDVEKLRRAIEAELPFFSPNEPKLLLDWKLNVQGGRLSQWAAKNGISKGYASKLNDRVTTQLADRLKKPH